MRKYDQCGWIILPQERQESVVEKHWPSDDSADLRWGVRITREHSIQLLDRDSVAFCGEYIAARRESRRRLDRS